MTTTKKYNRSEIMKRAWVIYRKNNHTVTWSDSLKQSWAIAKSNGNNNIRIESLYNEYFDSIVYYINGKVNDIEIANDLAQETFAKLNSKLYLYDSSRGKINTYIYNIASNIITDYWRKINSVKRGSNNTISMDSEVELKEGNVTMQVESTYNDSDNDVEQKELKAILFNAINKTLKENEKQVFLMHYYEGYKYDEISEQLEIPLNTVKVVSMRAKKKLQNVLSLSELMY
jgi:RNA polymerase sigma-70 factor (ECF subfamily)